MTRLLRGIAIAVAVAAIVDPAVPLQRARPPIVDVRIGSGGAPDEHAASAAVRDDVVRALEGVARPQPAAAPDAIVIVNPSAADLTAAADNAPISIVLPKAVGDGPRILGAAARSPVRPGQLAAVDVTVRAGQADQAIALGLVQDGVELARVEPAVSRAGARIVSTLEYAPPAAGVKRLQVVLRGAQSSAAVDAVDVPLLVSSRPVRVVFVEPRPSWAATFVRRAVEADPAFDVGALTRASRGIEVRSGAAPVRVTAEALEPFDVAIAGAPDALVASEVSALEAFARQRGGSVVLLPDRRPSGPYVSLLSGAAFDELLLETPAELAVPGGGSLRTSELAVPREIEASAEPLAFLRHGAVVKPAVLSWAAGSGRIVFSGALDAWRYRAADGNAFARFWTGTIANLGAAAPPALSISVEPAAAGPGEAVTVRAAIRGTEVLRQDGRAVVPPIGATLVSSSGAGEMVRLWPTAETGVFEGRVVPAGGGSWSLRVTSGQHSAETPLSVGAHPAVRRSPADELVPALARGSGGVAVSTGELAALTAHVRGLSRGTERPAARPLRSPWWIVAFAGALCGEWWIRRRSGRR